MLEAKKIKLDEIMMVGITTRTDNQTEMSPNGKIGKLWDRFFQEGLVNKIEGKSSGNLYGLYYDYAGSGEKAEYSVLVGCMVSSLDSIPEGMESITLPTSNYAQFSTAGGEMIKETIELWGKVWSEWMSANPEARTYTGDFEEYEASELCSTNGKVKVYVATK